MFSKIYLWRWPPWDDPHEMSLNMKCRIPEFFFARSPENCDQSTCAKNETSSYILKDTYQLVCPTILSKLVALSNELKARSEVTAISRELLAIKVNSRLGSWNSLPISFHKYQREPRLVTRSQLSRDSLNGDRSATCCILAPIRRHSQVGPRSFNSLSMTNVKVVTYSLNMILKHSSFSIVNRFPVTIQ
jgi:hypothetical protein